ncbi:MAG: hypothetical protein RL369_1476 [Pseudomonadota bacterium]|jgi:hypothetical protein
MSVLRSALLAMLYDGQNVREPYIDLVKSLIHSEFEIARTYAFYDGAIRREGIVYILGTQEVYWLEPTTDSPRMLIVRDADLRENMLNMLALNPMYAKWFG